MKCLIVAALLAASVNPALASEDSVLLHCSGEQIGGKLDYQNPSRNVLIAKDLSWISLWDETLYKWFRQSTHHQSDGQWWYETSNGNKSTAYLFDPQLLTLTVSSDTKVLELHCFPITSPFPQG